MKLLNKWIFQLILVGAVIVPRGALGQSVPASSGVNSDDQDVDVIEQEMKKAQRPRGEKRDSSLSSGSQPVSSQVEKISDFARLQPYDDIVVIQRKYMPKTQRFELFGGLTNLINDPWFLGVGFNARAGYHLNETWGIEAVGTFLSTSSRDSVKDLSSMVGVNTSSLVSLKNYFGLNLLWNPIYGKLSLSDKKIVPFDMFFVLGGGSSSVSSLSAGTAGTLHFGMGQVFAITKSTGFRWDLGVNTFQLASVRYYNVFIDFGLNYFLPEVSAR